jgi:hypothetical protein
MALAQYLTKSQREAATKAGIDLEVMARAVIIRELDRRGIRGAKQIEQAIKTLKAPPKRKRAAKPKGVFDSTCPGCSAPVTLDEARLTVSTRRETNAVHATVLGYEGKCPGCYGTLTFARQRGGGMTIRHRGLSGEVVRA